MAKLNTNVEVALMVGAQPTYHEGQEFETCSPPPFFYITTARDKGPKKQPNTKQICSSSSPA